MAASALQSFRNLGSPGSMELGIPGTMAEEGNDDEDSGCWMLPDHEESLKRLRRGSQESQFYCIPKHWKGPCLPFARCSRFSASFKVRSKSAFRLTFYLARFPPAVEVVSSLGFVRIRWIARDLWWWIFDWNVCRSSFCTLFFFVLSMWCFENFTL